MRKSVFILRVDCLWDCNKVKALNLIFLLEIFSLSNWRKNIFFTDKVVNFIKLKVLTIFQWTIWNSQWFSGKYETNFDSIYTCKQEKLPQSIKHLTKQAQNGLKYVIEYMYKTFFCWIRTSPHCIHTLSQKLWLRKTCSHYHTYLYNHMWIKRKIALKFEESLNQRDKWKALQQQSYLPQFFLYILAQFSSVLSACQNWYTSSKAWPSRTFHFPLKVCLGTLHFCYLNC